MFIKPGHLDGACPARRALTSRRTVKPIPPPGDPRHPVYYSKPARVSFSTPITRFTQALLGTGWFTVNHRQAALAALPVLPSPKKSLMYETFKIQPIDNFVC